MHDYLREHAFFIQQRQDAHRLGWAGFYQVHTLLVVLKLNQSPVHTLCCIHLLLQLEEVPAALFIV